jgi:hypothetical protein
MIDLGKIDIVAINPKPKPKPTIFPPITDIKD